MDDKTFQDTAIAVLSGVIDDTLPAAEVEKLEA